MLKQLNHGKQTYGSETWTMTVEETNTLIIFEGRDGKKYTRSVRKVSSHFEYLENRSRGIDVTWQPVRGDLTVHP